MKKTIIFLFIIMIISLISNKQEILLEPNDSIRVRIIANSNNKKDQEIKKQIKKDIEEKLILSTRTAKNKEESKKLIKENILFIEEVIDKYNINYKINYGNNYFPNKTYKGLSFTSGNYESLVITLGTGIGDNWWCILFPPLCLLEAEEKNTNDVEYKFFFESILSKF